MRVASRDGPLSYKGCPEPEAKATVNEMEIIWGGYKGLHMVVRRWGVYGEESLSRVNLPSHKLV